MMKQITRLLSLSFLFISPVAIYAECQTSLSCDNDSLCDTDNDACHDSCRCAVTSKSFLSIRPFFEAASPAKVALVRNEMDEMRTHNRSLFQVVPFGGRTLQPEELAWYFGPSCKRVLHVTETQETDTDILSGQLNIVTNGDNFVGDFCLSPVQTFVGAGFNYRTHFGWKGDNRGFFIDVTLPVYYVRNRMNLQDVTINDGGGAATVSGFTFYDSIAQAFQQNAWCFGKITDCWDDTHVGVSEFDAQIGYGWGRKQAFMHSYVGVIIPTGNKVKSRKVFEPIIGWNHNTAFHFGSSFGIELWHNECESMSIWYELAVDSRYFFENKQWRSFDLKNKPWSRYMMVYQNLAQATAADVAPGIEGVYIGTPGINIFTQQMKVKPRFQRTYNSSFVVDICDWTLEGGYNFFCRDEECVRLACPWDQLVGVQYTKDSDGTLIPSDGPALKSLQGNGFTDSVQQIGNDYALVNAQTLTDYPSNIITACDLDLSSAEAPCLLSQRFYGAVGYTFDCRFKTLLGLGGEYEFAGDNTGINRWGVWGKVAVIF